MKKLLEAYRTNPNQVNHSKLQAHLNKHMMAVCMATPEEIAFLKTHKFSI
jgi:hypothetical protein